MLKLSKSVCNFQKKIDFEGHMFVLSRGRVVSHCNIQSNYYPSSNEWVQLLGNDSLNQVLQ